MVDPNLHVVTASIQPADNLANAVAVAVVDAYQCLMTSAHLLHETAIILCYE